jgi:hypothetical protein
MKARLIALSPQLISFDSFSPATFATFPSLLRFIRSAPFLLQSI